MQNFFTNDWTDLLLNVEDATEELAEIEESAEDAGYTL